LTYPVEKPKDEILYQGQPASYWIAQLKDRDPWFRRQAMWALVQLGPEKGSSQALAELLKDKDEGIRSAAALNLGRMGATAEAAVPELLAALEDEDQFVRLAAVRALGRICPDDETVRAALRSALRDKSEIVRRRTLDTLGEIGVPAEAYQPVTKRPVVSIDQQGGR
jgi:HEAT repeat protein